jgi:hypothetical protein
MAEAVDPTPIDHEAIMWGNSTSGEELAEHVRGIGYTKWLFAGLAELQPSLSMDLMDTKKQD